jgi:hypothetical protein
MMRHRATVVTVLQHGGRAGLDAELVFDADAVHVVARAIGQVLGADEERDALHAFGGTDHPREHEVDDVLGHVVFAIGDEYLRTEKLVAAVGLRFCARAHRGEVAAGLRLGQVHGAGPRPIHHLRDVVLLLLRRARRQ